MNSKLLRNLLFGLLLAGYLLYADKYILSTSFVIGSERYFILFDDAMISMRYARNLAHGYGLVWNLGERVEGFTNPLWVGFMAIFHLFPIPASKISLAIQISGALFLAANLYFVRKIVEEFTDNLLVMLAAVALTAFYAPLNTWGLLGMEVSLLTLIISAAVWIVLRHTPARFTPWIYVLLAAATLIRIDMAVPYVIILATLFITQPSRRRQHLLWGIGLLVLFLGGQTLGRYLYYGDILPNTYYLKVEGFPFALRILRGLYALFMLTWYSNWVLFLLPLALLLFRRDWKVVLLFMVFLGQAAYSVYVGGDAWEHRGGANRFISIAIPIFFILFVYTSDRIRAAAAEPLVKAHRWLGLASQAALAIFLIFSMLNFNALLSDWKSIERWALARRPVFSAGNEHYVAIALDVKNISTPDTKVAVNAAGSIPYFLGDQYVIDLLGKTDPVVAHGAVKTPMSIVDVPFMQPGHMKWDYSHSFGKLQPDIIVELREGTSEEAKPYLHGEYVLGGLDDGLWFYLRKDSPNIIWDEIRIKDQNPFN